VANGGPVLGWWQLCLSRRATRVVGLNILGLDKVADNRRFA
jgi:hypothetical protein